MEVAGPLGTPLGPHPNLLQLSSMSKVGSHEVKEPALMFPEIGAQLTLAFLVGSFEELLCAERES